MKKVPILLWAALCSLSPLTAQEATSPEPQDPTQNPFHINVALDTRFDFEYENPEHGEHESGFHGRYLNLMISGQITDKISFNFRQRLNKYKDIDNDVFSATDFIYVDYSPTPNWVISGGKQVVAIGGFEYDARPIDIFFASLYWNNIACYQFGVSAAYVSNSGKHRLTAQVCNSPYQDLGKSCYAYNLMWNGSMGPLTTIWSVNLMEYARDRYGNYISLGNRLDFSPVYFEFDVMNRYWGHQPFWFDDYSLIGKLGGSVSPHVDIYAKGGYEHYRPDPASPARYDEGFYGMAVEYYPLKNSRNLRFHAVADMNHSVSDGHRYVQLAAGVMWRVNVFKK